MSIVKCSHKDSLGRPCNQHKNGEPSMFCGLDNDDTTCSHLATAYLKYKEVKDGDISDETKVWLSRHNKELYRQVTGDNCMLDL